MTDLFEPVRKVAPPGLWSRGVEIARAGEVSGEEETRDEITLRIAGQGLHSYQVVLHLEDAEWECNCPSGEDACEHVAAAVIALRQARADGKRLPKPTNAVGKVGYRFRRTLKSLEFERVIVTGTKSQALATTLAAIASGRVDGPRFAATQADLAVERTLGTHLRGVLPKETMAKLLGALSGCTDILLDEETVEASDAPVVPEVRLEDQGSGFRLFAEPPEGVRESFANGVALVGSVLRPIGQSKLTAREMEELAVGRHFPPEEAAKLVTEVLPSLADRVPLDVRTTRLPRASIDPPRLVLDVRADGESLAVLPTLVYGDPPKARIDAGKLVLFGGAVPLRDVQAEQRLVRQLQARLGLVLGHEERMHGEDGVRFARRLEAFDADIHGHGHETFFEAPPLVPRVELGEDRFELIFESSGTDSSGQSFSRRVAPDAALRAWRTGESLVPLLGGGWAPIPREWLEQHGDRVADLLAARAADGRVSRAALPDLARLAGDLGIPPPPDLARLRELVEDFTTVPETPLPEGLRATLRPYQKRGVDWLSFLREARLGALLADDMGLGKTLQALCAIRGRTLVVCPTSVLRNWENEARKFRPNLVCSVYHGPKRALDPAADVTITSYALLRLDSATLAAETWDTIVLDEAQAIKNPDSQVARAAYELNGTWRVTLSGTPVENRLAELWSQFHFLNPGLLGTRADFEERYAQRIAAGDERAAGRLRDRIRTFVLRRLKRAVEPELPPRTEVVLRCELSDHERRVYDTVLAAARKDVVQQIAGGGNVLAALEALLRLRQAASHPGLVPGEDAPTSAKVDLLLEELETVIAEGHKALVFSQWTSLLDRIEPGLHAAGTEFVRLDGATRDREEVVARFQDDAGPPVMLLSLKAGGTGLNLTAADHVFLMDPWWNPAAEDQAADRAHRIGQTRPVMVYRLVAEGTVEERILELQDRKRGLADQALAGAAGGITKDELLALVE